MIKKHKHTDMSDSLADVNEQELAKDGDRGSLFYTEESGRDTAGGDPLPENIDKKKTESARSSLPVSADIRREAVLSEHARAEREERTCEDGQSCENECADDRRDTQGECGSDSQINKRRGGSFYTAVILLCFAISAALLIYAALDRRSEGERSYIPDSAGEASGTETDGATRPDRLPSAAQSVYETGVRSTVTVVGETDGKRKYYSGFAVFDGGYIVTLYEALGKDSTQVITHEGKSLPCELIGADESVNLALLRAQMYDAEYVDICTDGVPSVGGEVFAVACLGNGEYASSLIAGEVAYLSRQSLVTLSDGIKRRVNALQLGSIGGDGIGGCPIFDREGHAVAICFVSLDGGGSLAFPLGSVLPVLECMRDGREISDDILCSLAFTPARLGILGEQTQLGEEWGVLVKGFSDEDSDAAIKLREGDMIFRVCDTPVTDNAGLSAVVEGYRAGESVEVFLVRGAQRLSFFVTLTG